MNTLGFYHPLKIYSGASKHFSDADEIRRQNIEIQREKRLLEEREGQEEGDIAREKSAASKDVTFDDKTLAKVSLVEFVSS